MIYKKIDKRFYHSNRQGHYTAYPTQPNEKCRLFPVPNGTVAIGGG